MRSLTLTSFDELAEHLERRKSIDQMNLPELLRALKRHDKMVESFYNDPMTSAMGCPTGDFQESFDRKERHILARISSLAIKNGSVEKMAFDRLEKWMP